MDIIKLGINIKSIRNQRKMTQKELADKISKTESSIRKYEKGIVDIPNKVISEIADALDVSINDLLGISENFESDFDTAELGDRVQNFIMMWRNKLNEVFEGKYFSNTDIVKNLLIDVIAKYDARADLNLSPEQNISTLFMVSNGKPIDPQFLYEHLKKTYIKDLKEEKKERLIPFIHEANKAASQNIELTDHLKDAVLEYYEDWFIEKIPPQFKSYFQYKIDQHEKYKEMDELNKKHLSLDKEELKKLRTMEKIEDPETK